MNVFRLKPGKRYKRRDGSVSPPLERVLQRSLVDPETGFYFASNDGFVFYESDPHPKDLIEEFKE